ncbi:pancreatic lipase-related protein 2-like [Mytilus edulis]
MNSKLFGFLLFGFFAGVLLIDPIPIRPEWFPPPFRPLPSTNRIKRSAQCYGDLGCFTNTYPYNNTGDALPLNPRFIRTRFLLYTSINDRFPRIISRAASDQLSRSRYNSNLPTKIIIHGFEQYGMVSWTRQMTRQFILKEPTNVVVVDWGHGSGWPYTQAVANTRVVGAEVAKMIEFLIEETGGDVSKFHLIGHSLGAHVAGYAGELVTGLGRITGLDPAEPNYKGTDVRVRLDPGDANFVDVVHTDGSPFDEISGYGLIDPVGHIDFYPNGGKNQPGCTKGSWINLFSHSYSRGISGTESSISCSHSRSIALFTESINGDCRFRAFPCDSFNSFKNGQCMACGSDTPCPIMGINADKYENTDRKPRGKFYLATGKSDPYCGYMYGIAVHVSSDMQPTEGILDLTFTGDGGQIANHTVYRAEYRAGHMYSELLVSPNHLSTLSTLTIEFLEKSEVWSWLWTGKIKIDKIEVTDGLTDEITNFCGNDVIISSGGRVVLTGSSSPC